MGNDPNWNPGGIFGGPQEAAPVLPDHQAACHACSGMAPLPPGPIHDPSCPLHVAQVPAPQPPTPSYREPAGKAPDPSNARRAMRKLAEKPPSDFEKVIDLFYEWRKHEPGADATEIMRKLLAANHNVGDPGAVKALEGLIKELRMKKITAALTAMGLDNAEKMLGLDEDAPKAERGDDF
jgi:hypothetical protein